MTSTISSFKTPNNTVKSNVAGKVSLRYLQNLFIQVDFISDYDAVAPKMSDNQFIYKIDTQVNSDTKNNSHTNDAEAIETWQVNQLIKLFNATFAHLNVVLVLRLR